MGSKKIQENGPAVIEDIGSLSIHGIPRVVSTKSKYVRIFWLSLSIFAVIGLSTTAFKSFSGYFRREITIKTASKQNHILTLPAITFCHTDYVFDYSKDVPVSHAFPSNCSNRDADHNTNTANLLSFSVGCKMFFDAVSDAIFVLNQQVDKTFRFPDNFTFVPYRYPCFTFNTKSLLVQKAEGEENGIHMLLYDKESVNKNEKVPNYMFLNGILDTRRGISVWVHDPKRKIPFGTGVRLLPGFQTQISIQKNVMKKLQHPYPSNCAQEEADKWSVYPGKNTMRMCYASCFYKRMYSLCGGVLPSARALMQPSRYPWKVNTTEFWSCLAQKFQSIDYTKCGCRPNCYEMEYKLTVSRSVWPRKAHSLPFTRLINYFEGEANRSLSTEEIRDRLVKLSLYYEDFMETVYEETPLYDLLGIASDLGGQMGLFLGASILSLIEIAALLIEVIKRKLYARMRVRDSGNVAEDKSHCDA